jgi:hypothetical protein
MSPWYCRLRRLDRLYTWESMNWTIIAATTLITTELARPLLEQRSRRLRKVAIGLTLFVITGFAFAQQRQGAAPGSQFSAVDQQQLRAVTASVNQFSAKMLIFCCRTPARSVDYGAPTRPIPTKGSDPFQWNKNSPLYKSLFDSSGFARHAVVNILRNTPRFPKKSFFEARATLPQLSESTTIGPKLP